IAHLAQHLQADIIVVALIGERGREVGEFVNTTLGPTALARSVVVAATSDMSPLLRQKTAQSAMSIAEYFRDQGLQVAYFADSITRFAEAYREVALSAGELPALRGYPASLAHSLMALCERAGPGCAGMGDITALFSVLVPGSDMEDPVADILRGVLDGHVVLSRAIAERGRFPAIDLLRSVSRALPLAASPEENHALRVMRAILGAYETQETLIKAGLYEAGSDPLIEDAIKVWPALDRFIGAHEAGMIQDSFEQLFEILRQTQSNTLL
ncbi:MAG: flagellum-specific ATP synthase FliI, partial [Rhodobacteraceae bacterium]|nr:flagellum-specific ATP synthase FliI [Paracoccaceae bacterium]